MCLRISSCVLALGALTACEATQSPEPEGDTIECAIGVGAQFGSGCILAWIGEVGGQEFVIYHPDGGFRRFMLNEDASGVAIKGGAEEVELVEPSPQGFWQFSVSGDRYLMPVPSPSGA